MLLEERDKKQPCSKHFNGKMCAFGSKCRFSHKTPSQLQYMEDLYRLECHKRVKQFELDTSKRIKNKDHNILTQGQVCLEREEDELLDKYFPKYELPVSILKKKDLIALPPSLLPPTKYDLINSTNLNTWK